MMVLVVTTMEEEEEARFPRWPQVSRRSSWWKKGREWSSSGTSEMALVTSSPTTKAYFLFMRT